MWKLRRTKGGHSYKKFRHGGPHGLAAVKRHAALGGLCVASQDLPENARLTCAHYAGRRRLGVSFSVQVLLGLLSLPVMEEINF